MRKVDPYYESLNCFSLKRVGLLDFLVFILSLSENNLSKWTWIIARRWEGMCRGFIGTTKCPRKSFLRIQSNQLLAFECVTSICDAIFPEKKCNKKSNKLFRRTTHLRLFQVCLNTPKISLQCCSLREENRNGQERAKSKQTNR